MTVVEWLRFVQARSQVDQDWMQAVMTRVLIRARWMDKLCQGMFYGWKMAYDRYRGTERQLETATRSLDGARRSAHNDRLLLLEFRSQSPRLQDEMAEDVERLQDQLTEAEGEVDQVRANLVALTRQVEEQRVGTTAGSLQCRGTLPERGVECRPCRVRETQLGGRRHE